VTASISPEDRMLIEHARKVNKTLSMLVFALQERAKVAAETHIGIADQLVELADNIRARGSRQCAYGSDIGPLAGNGDARPQVAATAGDQPRCGQREPDG
jgi:hypothetical protein